MEKRYLDGLITRRRRFDSVLRYQLKSKMDADRKLIIIGQRRKNQARARIGQLIFQMFLEGRHEFHGMKAACELLKMDIRTFGKHIGFRFYDQGAKKKSVMYLSETDFEAIRETARTVEKLKGLQPDTQRIVQYVFMYLYKNG